MSDRMSDETFEAMLRSKGYGDLDASLALNVEARRARKAEDALRAQLAAVNAERDTLKQHECVPTQWAYDQVCAALAKAKAECERKDEALRRVRSVVAGYQRPSETHVAVIDAALSPAQTKPALVPITEVLRIIREQPNAPDTRIGTRQQWVREQIAAKVEALVKP